MANKLERATWNPLQCKEIEAANTPEDINTGGDTISKTSDDDGDPINDATQNSPSFSSRDRINGFRQMPRS